MVRSEHLHALWLIFLRQVDKHLDNLQSEFDGHRSSAGGKEAAIAHGGRNTCSES